MICRRGAVVSLVCMALAACAPMRLDYESPAHVVQRGETLYTIAWQYGVDYRAIARWNNLADPNLIYPGQRLQVRPTGAVEAAVPSGSRAAQRPPQTVRTPSDAIVVAQPPWSWPTRGRIAARFGSEAGISSGVAIAGARGQPVRAAAGGRIVYVGTGLAGYGQLIIIQHNEAWLSAYGHTEQIVVSQGDSIEQGERIASVGLGPRREPRLHFEIRHNGVPLEPLSLLPAQP